MIGARASELHRGAGLLFLAGWVLLGFPGAARAQDAPPDDLDILRRKAAALRERVREPILLEGTGFRLLLDRRDPSFRLEDTATRVNWHIPVGRRGFATVLLPLAGGRVAERPIDGHEDLEVRADGVRFRGVSSAGEVPDVHFVFSETTPPGGLEIRVEADASALAGGLRIRLLDRALWCTDRDEGGVVVPRGLGEWHEASSAGDLRVRLRGAGESEATGTEIAPARLNALGLRRRNSGLLLVWEPSGTQIDVVRREVTEAESELVPGERLLETSVTVGAGGLRLRIFPMGNLERRESFATAYRQVLDRAGRLPSLAARAGESPLRGHLVGAPVFRLRPGGENGDALDSLVTRVRRLEERLGASRGLCIVEGWRDRASGGESSPPLRVSERCGGDGALARAVRSLHEIGYLLGLDLELPTGDSPEEIEFFRDELSGFQERVGADLVFLRGSSRTGATAGEADEADWLEVARAVSTVVPRLGGPFLGEEQIRLASYVEGPLDPDWFPHDRRHFFPMVSAVHGRHARLVASEPGAPGSQDTGRFFDHLLLGEVPLYDLTEWPGRGVISPIARGEGGWYGGRDFTAAERFLRTSQEVLGPVARLRARNDLVGYRTLTEDGSVEEIFWGFDLRIVVNRGDVPYSDEPSRSVLPPAGFWVQHPFFLAFHASEAFGVRYETPALFTVTSLEGKLWLRADRVRIWHGFGPSRIRLGGRDFDVSGELITRIW